MLLSSVLWDFTDIYTQAIADIGAGTFGAANYDLTVANGISLLKTDKAPAEVWTEIETAQQGIADGSIEVPLTPTQAAAGQADRLAEHPSTTTRPPRRPGRPCVRGA